MNRKVRVVVALALPCTGAAPVSYAQQIEFGKIDKFESLATGTLHVGRRPKPLSMMANASRSCASSMQSGGFV